MLKRTAIRALCNTTAYQRGLDIYRTGKRIQSLDIKSEGAVDKISAAVKGSGRNVYNTGFQYDTEADRIKEAYCDCPAFRSYSGICKHCDILLIMLHLHPKNRKQRKLSRSIQNSLPR